MGSDDASLAGLPVGQRARVRSLAGQGALRRRLMEMGVLPGTEVEVLRVAPLGDPLEVRVRGYSLSIRRDDARIVILEPAGRT
jgi:Fe2+ transport system protein FeoA